MRVKTKRLARSVLGVAILAAAGLALLPGAAAPAGTIVIRGAPSGSKLEITVDAGALVVNGYMAPGRPQGCHPVRGRMGASCPLAGADLLEIDMGPHGDFVRILHKLPVAVVAHLGAGSDKFIGNGEQDTCYSEGARRNRCVLGAGNDVCITGQRNSDCVGGPGNDYCRHGRGSDGCWGGPGNDVCVMGPGEDGCHGEGGNDRLYGGPGADQLYGGPGRDYCNGGRGRGKSHGCEYGPGH